MTPVVTIAMKTAVTAVMSELVKSLIKFVVKSLGSTPIITLSEVIRAVIIGAAIEIMKAIVNGVDQSKWLKRMMNKIKRLYANSDNKMVIQRPQGTRR